MVLKYTAAVCGAEIDTAEANATQLLAMFAGLLPCRVMYYSVCIVKMIKSFFKGSIKLHCLRM